jgi:hypothetical protein
MRSVLTAVAVLLLAGCAIPTPTPTPYQPKGFSGGYSDVQLDKNVFRVSFRGNGFTSRDRAEELALLRSAELTLKSGFTHFIIVDGRSSSQYGAFTAPTMSTTTGSTSLYGNTAFGSATTTTTGGQTFMVRKPSVTNTIVCFDGKPNVNALVFDAQFVFTSLAKKYEAEGVGK